MFSTGHTTPLNRPLVPPCHHRRSGVPIWPNWSPSLTFWLTMELGNVDIGTSLLPERTQGHFWKTQITKLRELNLEQDVMPEFEEEFKNKPHSLWLEPIHVDMYPKSPFTCALFGRKKGLSATGCRLECKPWCPWEVMCLVLILDRLVSQAAEKRTVMLAAMGTDQHCLSCWSRHPHSVSFCTQSALICAFSQWVPRGISIGCFCEADPSQTFSLYWDAEQFIH